MVDRVVQPRKLSCKVIKLDFSGFSKILKRISEGKKTFPWLFKLEWSGWSYHPPEVLDLYQIQTYRGDKIITYP